MSKSDEERSDRRSAGSASARYVELSVTSNFSFLLGGSHPEEIVERAAQLGYRAVAITDRHTLAGIVRAHVAAKAHGIHLVVGSRIGIDTSQPSSPYHACEILVHPTDIASYGQLCRMLTLGKRRAAKGACHLSVHDLLEHAQGDGLLCTVLPPRSVARMLDGAFVELVEGLRRALGDRLSIAITRLGDADDELRSRQLVMLAEWTSVPLVATNDVHYHVPERRPLQDVLTCIRRGCTLDRAGYSLFPNAERHLRSPEAMETLFSDLPNAIARASELADRTAGFSLDQLRYRYPSEVVPPGTTAMSHLRDLTWRGAAERYPTTHTFSHALGGIPDKVRRQIEYEFRLIDDLHYAQYFLTVHDLVAFARSRDILCQGRGAAANSAVCYCLGITAVDPNRIDVLFERFISKERNEPPDIDVDFEHERREEVIQYLYRKYGRDRAALTAEVISYRGRSAVRDVGKALGLSLDCVDRLASGIDWWHDGAVDVERVREIGLNPRDPTIRQLAALSTEILGFPRHLSQHVGGFVITDGPLCEIVPIENAAMADRTVIEWDKDDIDAMGMLKVDVLALGMLTCIRKAIDLVNEDISALSAGEMLSEAMQKEHLAFHTIPAEDPLVYDMICRADTVGVFQIESRAQMSMLPRLRPRVFYDLVIEVAIVRPGPIQGDMVHPYLRRRNGEEPINYPDDAVKAILSRTLGVPLFQEQAMSLAIVAAGFTPGEADQLRRAIAAWKRKGNRLAEFAAKLESGMLARGYTQKFAQQVFTQIQGFSGYGFPESHAASFALLVYVSSWLKCHEPAAFAAALINSQPMGFYAPAQIVRDAIEHGVHVRAVDVNASRWDCTLERSNPLAELEQSVNFAGPTAASPVAMCGWWPLDPTDRRAGAKSSSRQREREALLRDPSMCVPNRQPSIARDQPAIRLGLRLVRGVSADEAVLVERAVERDGPFATIESLWRSSDVRVATLRRLAAADAFRSMGFDRQHALWQIRSLRDESLPMWEARDARETAASRTAESRAEAEAAAAEAKAKAAAEAETADMEMHTSAPRILPQPSAGGGAERSEAEGVRESTAGPPEEKLVPNYYDELRNPPPLRSRGLSQPTSRLPPVSDLAAVAHDYTAVGLSLKQHPMSCVRPRIAARGAVPCGVLRNDRLTPQGTRVAVAGIVLVRQRPSTAKGIVFVTLEDESGIANLIIRPKIYTRCRKAVRNSVILLAHGIVERRDDVVHLLVHHVEDASAEADAIDAMSRDFH
ncbi:MAG: error-prone DNA polymerase [Phycisphaerae bacterium]|nr:error-prone DNA polymerase [Phycisphaerae bacterium]